MKSVELSFNSTQKLRLDAAFQQLESLSVNSNAVVTVADTIPVDEDASLKGHGTLEMGKNVVATVCGVIERVNKLVSVRAFSARYKPEVGDIIVGRVIEVAPKRWRLEINFSQDAVLMLSSMNLPDGIQRRRTAIDELNMRSIFVEEDVICAEVRGFQHDGSLHLQARSQKYGKLERGFLVKIPPYLVKRRKQHFHHLDQYGVDVIFGCNGVIWIGEHVDVNDAMVVDQVDKSDPQNTHSGTSSFDSLPLETRQYIIRIGNAIRVFAGLGFMVSLEAIMETVDLSVSLNLSELEMLEAEFHVRVAEQEVERRNRLKRRR